MQYAFQDYENIYLVMDLLTGGDLRYHVSRHKKYTEEQTRLEYLHTNNILHRDIKPENLVLDDKGYVRITDFGIAKFYQKENYTETSGTPGYMSPEVMCAQNHTIAVDYFALGVITFEFMMGFRPYTGKSRKEIKEKIISKQVQLKKEDIPSGWASESADFVNRLLQRKPANRMGLRGAQEVKEHPWLKFFSWKELYDKTFEAPFIPKHGDNFDSKYCNAPDKIGQETKERYESYLRNETIKDVFKGFTFNQMDSENDVFSSKLKDNNSKNQSMDVNTDKYKNITKFNNPHLNISNLNMSTSNLHHRNNSFCLTPKDNKNNLTLINNDNKNRNNNQDNINNISLNNINNLNNNYTNLSNIENKFLKMKKQTAASSSTSSLLRQYKMTNNSNNNTSISINYVHRRSGSLGNSYQ